MWRSQTTGWIWKPISIIRSRLRSEFCIYVFCRFHAAVPSSASCGTGILVLWTPGWGRMRHESVVMPRLSYLGAATHMPPLIPVRISWPVKNGCATSPLTPICIRVFYIKFGYNSKSRNPSWQMVIILMYHAQISLLWSKTDWWNA